MAIAPRRIRWVVVASVAVVCMSAPAAGQTTNQPPQCPADPVLTVVTGQPLVLPGSPCSDPEGQPVTLILVEGPHHGALVGPAANGSLTYTSEPGYVGTDLIRFKASDGSAESPVATLTIRVTGQAGGQGGGVPRGRIQQQVESGAMLPGQRLPIWVLVSELDAGQQVSVRIEPSGPVRNVDPACVPDGAAYLCAVRAGPRYSTTTLRLKFVAATPGTFTLTSRIVHSGVETTDAIIVLAQPKAGRTVAVVDEGSCTHGRWLTARTAGASTFRSVCPGATLPVRSSVRWGHLRWAELYWTRRGSTHHAQVHGYRGQKGQAQITQPRGRAPQLRVPKPGRCRGYKSVQADAHSKVQILGRLVRVTLLSRGSAVVREYCDKALVFANSPFIVRDLVHGGTVRLSGGRTYVVSR